MILCTVDMSLALPIPRLRNQAGIACISSRIRALAVEFGEGWFDSQDIKSSYLYLTQSTIACNALAKLAIKKYTSYH